ncbi:MAG: hypothetical protein AAGE52_31330 [Myxococcota bacterium]
MRATLIALVFAFGCQVGVFGDLEGQAPIAALSPPSEYPTGVLGRVMSAYVGEDAFGNPIARVVAAGGPGTPQVIFDVWSDGELGSLSGDIRCDEPGAMLGCELGTSGDVVGLEVWDGMRDCYLTSGVRLGAAETPDEGTLRIACERMNDSFGRARVEAVDLGSALAALPEGHPAGVALIGAPGASSAQGTVFRLQDREAAPGPLALPLDLVLESGDRLGTEVVTAEFGASLTGLEDAVTVAASARGARRVVVFELGTSLGVLESRLVGCIDEADVRAPADLQGGGLVLGDVGSGPAVFIGESDVSADGGLQPVAGSVRIVELDALNVAGGCTDRGTADDAASSRVNCDGVSDVSCSAFGRGLAVGDVNDDGVDDLLVGAPLSTVDGSESGTLVVFEGSAAGLGAGRAVTPTGVSANDLFGQSVEVTQVRAGTDAQRDEPIVAAPGGSRLYLPFCTGVAGDTVMGGDRCQ